jgi:hypothetical protein
MAMMSVKQIIVQYLIFGNGGGYTDSKVDIVVVVDTALLFTVNKLLSQ